MTSAGGERLIGEDMDIEVRGLLRGRGSVQCKWREHDCYQTSSESTNQFQAVMKEDEVLCARVCH